ncbi:hypothetical protein SAMN05216323_11135 [Williamwhitmania taraxaci]|uniref:Uncharacterized protein n=1 Tax=Williamwhitmania taraxaci TaxID=1640674 RepID=A0A1G6T6H0_9BACT|nr:hypothetical protein SAMN05216323_11135 [Williamwhitmania taraxaci]
MYYKKAITFLQQACSTSLKPNINAMFFEFIGKQSVLAA